MTDPTTLRQQANEQRKQKNFEGAVSLYQTLWDDHQAICTEWDAWGYAFSLRKAGRSADALDICRAAYPRFPNFEQLRSVYSWCIYDLEIKHDSETIKQQEAQFLKAANAILTLSEPGQYTPTARTVMKVVDYLKDARTIYPARQILEWLDRLGPDDLSLEVGTGKGQDGKQVEYASDREKWYAERCKALQKENRFQECLDVGEQALADVPRFHYDNDVWIPYRMALAKAELGNKEEAIEELRALLGRKRDWFFYSDIANLLIDLGRKEEALSAAIEAALAPGDLEHKWELFFQLGQLLGGYGQEANDHFLLAATLRQEHEWKAKPELQQALDERGLSLEDAPDSAALRRKLEPFWRALKFAGQEQLTGEIEKLVGDGKRGFIRATNGQSFFFRSSSFRGPKHRIQPGLRVKFYVEPNPQAGKSDSAVSIEAI